MANSTPDTPDISETKLAALKMDQLRAHARKLGIDEADELHKPELLAKVKDHHYAQAHGGKHRSESGNGSTPANHPSASELSRMKLGELREHARKLGIDGADELHEPELLAKVKDHHAAASRPSATELSRMKLGELREHAHKHGIDGADELHKPELLAKVKHHHAADSGRREASSATKNRGGNSTPDTPEVGETKLAALKMDELREHARKLGIDGADELHKPELLAKVKDHHYAPAHDGKHRSDTGSGSPGRAEAPSTANEDRGGNSTPDTPQANKTALSVASTDKPQDRPHPPGIHSSEVHETDEPAQPELRATVAGAPTTTEDEHLSPLEQERPDPNHTAATAPRATAPRATETTETAETTGASGATGTSGATEPTGSADDDEGRVTAESTHHAGTGTLGGLDVDTRTRESGPARLPEQVLSGHQQVSAPVPIEEVDRESTAESIREVADDDQAIFGKQPAGVRPAGVLPEELSVVDPRAVLEDRDVPDTTIHTAPATVGGEIRTGRSEVDVDVPNIHGG
jgi:hypothetical protein